MSHCRTSSTSKTSKKDSCVIKNSNKHYSKYLNQRVDNGSLSKQNKLYVQRLLKQNEEYRSKKNNPSSSSVESIKRDFYIPIESRPKPLPEKSSSQPKLKTARPLEKKDSKTYRKYLKVIHKNYDYENYIKNSNENKKQLLCKEIADSINIEQRMRKLNRYYSSAGSSQLSTGEMRYSKDMENKMAERMLDASFSK